VTPEDARAEIGERHRKVLRAHLPVEQPLHAIFPRRHFVHVEITRRRVGGDEEGEALDVVPMHVAEKKMRFEPRAASRKQIEAELA
jgi:hypothetical protein